MSHKHFTIDERESILESLALGLKNSEIAKKLGRNRSSVGREVKRNSVEGKYSPHKAQNLYSERKKIVELRKNLKILYFCWIFRMSLKKDGYLNKSLEGLKRMRVLILALRQSILLLSLDYY